MGDSPRQPGFVKHPLVGMDNGELELELVYMPGDAESAEKSPETFPETCVGTGVGSWLVMRTGEASKTQSFTSAGPLRCPAGHAVDKRKVALHWHEGWLGAKHGNRCDLCGNTFTSREQPRWRCAHHCQFDVCESCHNRSQ